MESGVCGTYHVTGIGHLCSFLHSCFHKYLQFAYPVPGTEQRVMERHTWIQLMDYLVVYLTIVPDHQYLKTKDL
jgi:hypothetical protein